MTKLKSALLSRSFSKHKQDNFKKVCLPNSMPSTGCLKFSAMIFDQVCEQARYVLWMANHTDDNRNWGYLYRESFRASAQGYIRRGRTDTQCASEECINRKTYCRVKITITRSQQARRLLRNELLATSFCTRNFQRMSS